MLQSAAMIPGTTLSPTAVLQDAHDGRLYTYLSPQTTIIAHTIAEVRAALTRAARLARERDWYAVGYLAYEAAAAFDAAFTTHPPDPNGPPLLWFRLYADRRPYTAPTRPQSDRYKISAWTPTIGRDAYTAAIKQIKQQIAAGNTYQVNYTYRLRADFDGDPMALFHDLQAAQTTPAAQANYAAYLDLGRWAICSASPELFFHRHGRTITAKPMKGTAPRGLTFTADEEQAAALRHSPKNRAENVMIVDMIRNDMGRIARTGSVRVPHLFTVDRYPTLWQMTSTVTAELTADMPADRVLAALFPCASITGAPKASTMRIIRTLETTSRGVYTGAIGRIAPNGDMQFNVAIRTAVIDRQLGRAEYGTGSGIVWDSEPTAEFDECRLKADLLTVRRTPFQLLETLLWTPEDGYFLLNRHLRRMAQAAAYFGFGWAGSAVQHALDAHAAAFEGHAHRVRVCLNTAGQPHITAVKTTTEPQAMQLAVADTPIDKNDPFLYHKTTRRAVYDRHRAAHPHADDVILWNEDGRLTETCIGNLVLKINGRLLTPPVSAGLLAGTFRAHLLAGGRIATADLTCDHLQDAEEIYLINSVRRWCSATLLSQSQTAVSA